MPPMQIICMPPMQMKINILTNLYKMEKTTTQSMIELLKQYTTELNNIVNIRENTKKKLKIKMMYSRNKEYTHYIHQLFY